MKAREGDLLQTVETSIFDVKGLIHPPQRIIAFPRFIASTKGGRWRDGSNYRKIYSLSERYTFLKSRLPNYLVHDRVFGEILCEVPSKDVRHHFMPSARLQEMRDDEELDELESAALSFVELLQKHSGVHWNDLGISGSLLVKMHIAGSDIDPIVYGTKNSLRLHEALKALKGDKQSSVKPYSRNELRSLYGFRRRDTRVAFDDFTVTERRKVLQGRFLGRDFFIRCVKDWSETAEHYGDRIYKPVGRARIKAKVVGDEDAIFTPCRYSVEEVQVLEGDCGGAVSEIASFRGRFCEQAERGETFIAEGKVEEVQGKDGLSYFRLLLGAKPSDFMILEK